MTQKGILAGKRVLFGISGGIGAYKAYTVMRELIKQGAEASVIATKSASQFVSKTVIETFTGNPYHDDMFGDANRGGAVHISLARRADCFIICPATANIIGKAAHGIADDLLSTSILVYEGSILFAPAMNSSMYLKSVVQENIGRLKSLGHEFIGPETGDLATLEEGSGIGRLAREDIIIQAVEERLLRRDDLAGKKVLVTAGRTEEPIDPVRYLSNRSSGRMGFAAAREARLRGAEVTLISGIHDVPVPHGIRLLEVKTACEMAEAVNSEWKKHDILVMSAAVADYRVKESASRKLKRGTDNLTLEPIPNEDILALAAKHKKGRLVIGFALETEKAVENGKEKLRRKNLDMIVVNNPNEPGAGFGTETNRVAIITAGGKAEELPLMSKNEVARELWDRAVRLLKQRARR